MQWNKKQVNFLKRDLRQVQNQEQTLELRLNDGMPEIGSVLCAWGQPIIRSKEWRSDSMVVTGGVHACVLYKPEDGSAPQNAECWLPFQAKWNLPESRREGIMRVSCLLRSIDARTLSSRKLMVRAAMGMLAEAMEPAEETLYTPEQLPEDVQILENTYPMTLPKEGGEKLFLMDEEVQLPQEPARLIAWDIEPYVQEQNVVGDKAALKGAARLHLVYMGTNERIYSHYIELPFAQYVDLDHDYDKEATVSTMMAVSNLEAELIEGHVHVRCGLIAQYMIYDWEYITVAEDAYSPFRVVEVHTEPLELPAVLESQKQSLDAEKSVETELADVADIRFYPDYPAQYRDGNEITVEEPGVFQVLGYDPEGNLQAYTENWTEKLSLAAGEGCSLCTDMYQGQQPVAVMMGGNMQLSGGVELCMQAVCCQMIPMVSDIELGAESQSVPERPSLILKRAEDMSLWQIAKACGSTVDAIRKANQLNADPTPGQMLLIPVC